MAKSLKFAAIAAPVELAQPTAHAIEQMTRHLQSQLDAVLPDHPDLILLRECCDRYDTMPMAQRLAYYHDRGEQIRDYLAQLAQREDTRIVYSYVRELADGTRRNSALCLAPDGQIEWCYNKNFPMPDGEIDEQNIRPGTPPENIATPIGRIGALICFDLNFQTLREHYRKLKPELLLFSSFFDGGLLRNFWAFRCRSYVLSATPVGAALVNPLGIEVARSTEYTRYLSGAINLDFKVVHLDNHREKLLEMKKFYGSKVNITDPGHSGVVMVSSETRVSAETMLKKFDIIEADDYLDAAEEQVNIWRNCN